MNIRVKICCISSVEEAQLAISCGASALGLVSHMPSGPGVIPEELIRQIAACIPPAVDSFLLTSQTNVERIIAQQQRCGGNTLQLVDKLSAGSLPRLRAALPGIKLVQVIHVRGRESVEEAVKVSREADALLLDSGHPDRKIKELGGTGRVHDWELSRQIRDAVALPVFLAGGLNPENVRQAVDKVQPFGVDVCSGVRSNGRLDATRLQQFFTALR